MIHYLPKEGIDNVYSHPQDCMFKDQALTFAMHGNANLGVHVSHGRSLIDHLLKPLAPFFLTQRNISWATVEAGHVMRVQLTYKYCRIPSLRTGPK